MRQRSYALAARLKVQETGVALDVIKVIRNRALQGDEDFLRLYNGLLFSGTLVEVLGPHRVSKLVALAQERGDFEVVAVFLDLQRDGTQDTPHQPFLDAGLREVPLGMRKALAKKPDFKIIKRIARDQDHRVIRNLLDNPRLTEADVIRIGATRPTSPKVLEEIFRHPRWITRYAVKKVIVFNPYSPLLLSLRLLGFLNVQDLEELTRRRGLNSELLNQAARVLEEKSNIRFTENSLEL